MAILTTNRRSPSRREVSPRRSWPEGDPELETLVREIIERVADKWTMLVLAALEEHGRLRFTRLGEVIGGVSQKMLTKTVRQMEADGLVVRTVFPVIPPRVEYELTGLGGSPGGSLLRCLELGQATSEGHHAGAQDFSRACRSSRGRTVVVGGRPQY